MLQLDENYRVLVDSSQQNLILEKYSEVKIKGTEDTKFEWGSLGFHGLSLRSVLHSYAKHKLTDGVNNVDNVNLLISKINQLERTIEKVSKNITFEVKSNDK